MEIETPSPEHVAEQNLVEAEAPVKKPRNKLKEQKVSMDAETPQETQSETQEKAQEEVQTDFPDETFPSHMSTEPVSTTEHASDEVKHADEVSAYEEHTIEEQMQTADQPEDQMELGIEEEQASSVVMDVAEIQSCIEAILFISDKPISRKALHEMLGLDFDRSLFDEALQEMTARYQGTQHGIELIEVSGGYQFRTKVGRAHLAKKLVRTQVQRLSGGGMETLAIIAYKQPVMKEEVDKVRGVDSSYFIRGLMDKRVIEISGRSELPGRPLLYSTTPQFLELFGLKDLSALPSLRELEQMIPTSEVGKSSEDTPQTRELRRLVGAMNDDKSSELYYNPREDEKLLKEIRERVSAISTTTPYLDELKAAEELAKQPPAEKVVEEVNEAPSEQGPTQTLEPQP